MADGFISNGTETGKPARGPDVELLYENPTTGRLGVDDSGRAFRALANESSPQFTRASLSGPQPSFGRGIGGTKPERDYEPQPSDSRPVAPPRDLSPDELMSMADMMEQDLMDRTRASEGSTEVDPALLRSGGVHEAYTPSNEGLGEAPVNPYGGTVNPDMPDWLLEYMEKVPSMGEFNPNDMDKVKGRKYLSEQEMLKHIKSKR